MLKPEDRHQLLAALRAPEGYGFDYAIGTTFSLDLMALLTVPLSFSFFNLENDDPRKLEDPIVLLDALRQFAGRMAIFCQAGQIAVPSAHELLYSYLENSVHEVNARSRQGVFHPKVWALRYVPQEHGDDQPVHYRLLCLSRNLTFDRSWDTMLLLDGKVTNRVNAFADNSPLGDFIASLPDLAVRPVSEEARHQVSQIEYELRRVRFDLPRGFNKLSFHVFGLKQGDRWPFSMHKSRALIVAPFITHDFLKRVAQDEADITLVSRLDTLSGLSSSQLAPIQSLYVLDPATESVVAPEPSPSAEMPALSEFNTPLSGLHAKLYLIEQGYDVQLWTGSANATRAAFHHNVEFMVCMTGHKRDAGIDRFLSKVDNQTSFRDLLIPYTPKEAIKADKVKEKLEDLIFQFRQQLARHPLTATVTGGEGEGSQYHLNLFAESELSSIQLPKNMELWCWPITLAETWRGNVRFDDERLAQFAVSLESLTSFFAFEVRAFEGVEELRSRFVMNVPLQNAPTGRQESVLRRLLGDRNRVMRYLWMLLATEDDLFDLHHIVESHPKTTLGQGGANGEQIAFFEPLVRALGKDPAKLDRIRRLVEDLAQNSDGASLLPDGFMDIWLPIWQARQRLIEDRATE